MIKTALIGHPVSHSLSGIIHNAAFKALGVEGKYEVIICFVDTPYIVRDPNNVGTYNFGTNYISHFFYDMIPYWRYGNSPEDTAVRNHSFIYGW